MNSKTRFVDLRALLEKLGFSTTEQPAHVLFEHRASKTLIPLRAYRTRDLVSATDLAVVRNMLDQRGLLEQEAFEQSLQGAPEVRR